MCGCRLVPHTFCAKLVVHFCILLFLTWKILETVPQQYIKYIKIQSSHKYIPSPIFISDEKSFAFRKLVSSSKDPVAPEGTECSARDWHRALWW